MLALSPAAISSNVRFSIVAVFDATMLSTRGILLAWMESDAQGVCAGHPEKPDLHVWSGSALHRSTENR
jgi:hypothetical protein